MRVVVRDKAIAERATSAAAGAHKAANETVRSGPRLFLCSGVEDPERKPAKMLMTAVIRRPELVRHPIRAMVSRGRDAGSLVRPKSRSVSVTRTKMAEVLRAVPLLPPAVRADGDGLDPFQWTFVFVSGTSATSQKRVPEVNSGCRTEAAERGGLTETGWAKVRKYPGFKRNAAWSRRVGHQGHVDLIGRPARKTGGKTDRIQAVRVARRKAHGYITIQAKASRAQHNICNVPDLDHWSLT